MGGFFFHFFRDMEVDVLGDLIIRMADLFIICSSATQVSAKSNVYV